MKPQKTALSETDIRVWQYLTDHNNGHPPSIPEIARSVGVRSTSTVWRALRTLERWRVIRQVPRKSRARTLLIPYSPRAHERIDEEIEDWTSLPF